MWIQGFVRQTTDKCLFSRLHLLVLCLHHAVPGGVYTRVLCCFVVLGPVCLPVLASTLRCLWFCQALHHCRRVCRAGQIACVCTTGRLAFRKPACCGFSYLNPFNTSSRTSLGLCYPLDLRLGPIFESNPGPGLHHYLGSPTLGPVVLCCHGAALQQMHISRQPKRLQVCA